MPPHRRHHTLRSRRVGLKIPAGSAAAKASMRHARRCVPPHQRQRGRAQQLPPPPRCVSWMSCTGCTQAALRGLPVALERRISAGWKGTRWPARLSKVSTLVPRVRRNGRLTLRRYLDSFERCFRRPTPPHSRHHRHDAEPRRPACNDALSSLSARRRLVARRPRLKMRPVC